MKHIFGIQSHLTFYVAHKIIQLKQFNPDDCFFISGRNYKIPDKYASIYKNIHISDYGKGKESRVFSGFNIFKTHRKIKQFDNLIDGFTGKDNYDCYLSYCGDDLANLGVTKKNCIAYYLTEEGSAVYYDNVKTFSGWRYWVFRLVLKPLYPRLFAIKEYLFYPDYYKFKGFYAISSQAYACFRDYPITVIGLPFETVDMGFTPEAVLSIDPFFRYLDLESTEKLFYHLSIYIKQKNYKTILYKFHPMFGVLPETKKAYEDALQRYFGNSIIQLDDTAVLENILMTYKCDFYSDSSSIQIYGFLAGAKCYDFSPFLNRNTGALSDKPFEECVREVQSIP